MSTPNMSTQLTGEKITRSVAAQAEAMDILSGGKSTVFSWTYVMLSVGGGALGWLMTSMSTIGLLWVGVVSGAAFFLSLSAFMEGVRQRQHLEAVICLIKLNKLEE